MNARRLLLTAATAVTLITMPLQARAEGTRYDDCMDRAEATLNACNKSSFDDTLCWSRYGYQKLWCTLRYLRDIV